ncbi:MAG: NAD(P)/FAD-dependent oxidoreductase [Planctomycetota bacterium]|nr:NAD(P)/FAD-dependent oxidoreductase [Planctomycetota bacterium]
MIDHSVGEDIVCDCLVIGGGPAGSVAASIVADGGYDVVQIEREVHPRPHVGESLMPATNEVLQRLGMQNSIEQLRFIRKVGVQFVSASGKASMPFYFRKHDDRPDSETWHVDRAKLDHCLFKIASERGVRTMESVRFLSLERNEPGKQVVLVEDRGQTRKITAKVLIDASGQQAVLAKHFQIKEMEAMRKNISIWTYYQTSDTVFADETITIIAKTKEANGWFWLIPVDSRTLSVGLVGDVETIHSSASTNADRFLHFVGPNEFVADYLNSSNLIQVGKFITAKDFSYQARQPAGEGWVLTGDALGFIDPVYSTGVLLALKTGELAGDAVVDCLNTGDLSKERLGNWYAQYAEKVELLRKLVDLFYDSQFSFGGFIADNPDCSYQLADLLMGRVFCQESNDFFEKVTAWKNQQMRFT